MMAIKKIFVLLFLVAVLVMVSDVMAADIVSLRGHATLEEGSIPAEVGRIRNDQPPIERNYLQQPPLIPHKIKGYKINQRSNKCLTCHSWKASKRSGATKISMTHFVNRDGEELANVSPRRYFCTQCHVTQKDVRPLVENTFEPIKALGKD